MRWDIETGGVVEVLREYPDNTFDAVLCDPPYGLAFMGKRWDYEVPSVDLWAEVLRVCKPGAPLLASFGTRTYHRGVCRIEDAGWEIRDSIAWMYGSGFPKSLDVSKAVDAHERFGGSGSRRLRQRDGREVGTVGTNMSTHRSGKNDVREVPRCVCGHAGNWHDPDCAHEGCTCQHYTSADSTVQTEAARLWSGYGTALKPAHEPYVLARKPLDGTVAQNVARWGVGALAIDACRVDMRGETVARCRNIALGSSGSGVYGAATTPGAFENHPGGRWPANVILDEDAGAALDEQTGVLRNGGQNATSSRKSTSVARARWGQGREPGRRFRNEYAPGKPTTYAGDSGGASRFFYCAKASPSERDAGCEDLDERLLGISMVCNNGNGAERIDGAPRAKGRNHHPTVKPLALCEYLARLILPPQPGAILVPFAGSGSEMIGALRAGWPDVLGIEREAEYVEIARRRLATL